MNNKAVTLSLVMAALAVYFVKSYVDSLQEQEQKKYGVKVMVMIAKQDIREMETLTRNMFDTKAVPKAFIEPAAVVFTREVKADGDESAERVSRDLEKFAGMVALVPIKKGEQITYSKISDPGLRTGLSPQVQPGKRAVSLPVNEVTAVGRLLKPGDRIDVIAVMRIAENMRTKVSKIILQDVPILSVGRSVTNNPARLVDVDPQTGKERVRSLNQYDTYSNVTVEVEPYQAQTLSLILSEPDNRINLVLRNNDDTNAVNLNGTTMADVIGSDVNRVMSNRVPAAGGAPR